MPDSNVPKEHAKKGLSTLDSTTLFRVTNFELYAKPNRLVMIVGIAAFAGCCTFLVRMRKSAEYSTVQTSSDGQYSYVKKSKWD